MIQVSWIHVDKQLVLSKQEILRTNNPRIRVRRENSTFVLIIEKATLEDIGYYACKVCHVKKKLWVIFPSSLSSHPDSPFCRSTHILQSLKWVFSMSWVSLLVCVFVCLDVYECVWMCMCGVYESESNTSTIQFSSSSSPIFQCLHIFWTLIWVETVNL